MFVGAFLLGTRFWFGFADLLRFSLECFRKIFCLVSLWCFGLILLVGLRILRLGFWILRRISFRLRRWIRFDRISNRIHILSNLLSLFVGHRIQAVFDLIQLLDRLVVLPLRELLAEAFELRFVRQRFGLEFVKFFTQRLIFELLLFSSLVELLRELLDPGFGHRGCRLWIGWQLIWIVLCAILGRAEFLFECLKILEGFIDKRVWFF